MTRRRFGDPLSAELMELLRLLADTDLSVASIARRLGVTHDAVEWRRRVLYTELGVADREGLRACVLACELAAVTG